jgi:hypothetical protein
MDNLFNTYGNMHTTRSGAFIASEFVKEETILANKVKNLKKTKQWAVKGRLERELYPEADLLRR